MKGVCENGREEVKIAVSPFIRRLSNRLQHSTLHKVGGWLATRIGADISPDEIKSVKEEHRNFRFEGSTFYLSSMGDLYYHSYPEKDSGWSPQYFGNRYWVLISASLSFHCLWMDLSEQLLHCVDTSYLREPYLTTIINLEFRHEMDYSRYCRITFNCQINHNRSECSLNVGVQRYGNEPERMTDEHIELESMLATKPFVPKKVLIGPFKPFFPGLSRFLQHLEEKTARSK